MAIVPTTPACPIPPFTMQGVASLKRGGSELTRGLQTASGREYGSCLVKDRQAEPLLIDAPLVSTSGCDGEEILRWLARGAEERGGSGCKFTGKIGNGVDVIRGIVERIGPAETLEVSTNNFACSLFVLLRANLLMDQDLGLSLYSSCY